VKPDTAGSTFTAVGRSQLLARWPGTHSRILSGIQRAAQTVLGVYLKRTCSRVTSASGALGVLNDYALYKSTHSLTQSLSRTSGVVDDVTVGHVVVGATALRDRPVEGGEGTGEEREGGGSASTPREVASNFSAVVSPMPVAQATQVR